MCKRKRFYILSPGRSQAHLWRLALGTSDIDGLCPAVGTTFNVKFDRLTLPQAPEALSVDVALQWKRKKG